MHLIFVRLQNNLTISFVGFVPQGDTVDSIAQAKVAVNEVAVAAQQSMYSQPCTLSQIQEREADIRALAELSRALDKKASLKGLVLMFVSPIF